MKQEFFKNASIGIAVAGILLPVGKSYSNRYLMQKKFSSSHLKSSSTSDLSNEGNFD